ncbi:MerR family transcriptional regulator [bacterium]|nr:MerR family transcriptional regulator [bacterium]
MKKNIYLLKEFIPVAGVSESQLKEWESLKILIPSGYTEDKTACYSDDSIKRAEHIKQLTALGYNLDDIQKIIKKVGLPSHTEDKNQPKEADKYLTVGHLSEAVGISTRTIKHWEEKGIIEPQMRSQGGFRLYPESYIYLCKLIVDLQLFGYTLDEIKIVSDHFREFLTIKQEIENMPYPEVDKKLRNMLNKIKTLTGQINQLKSGIQRWEDLLKKKKKEINQLINKNDKKIEQDKSNKPIKK